MPYLLFSSITIILLSGALPALAQDYVPLAPLPGIETGSITLTGYLQQFFNLGIRLAIILAVLMVTIGGVQYITSEGITDKSAARGRIISAIVGLLLAISSVLVIQTINPDLLNLDFNPAQSAPAPQQTPTAGGQQPVYQYSWLSVGSSEPRFSRPYRSGSECQANEKLQDQSPGTTIVLRCTQFSSTQTNNELLQPVSNIDRGQGLYGFLFREDPQGAARTYGPYPTVTDCEADKEKIATELGRIIPFPCQEL